MESGGVAMWWSTPYDEVQCIVCDEILGEQPVACVGVDPLLTSMMLDRGRLQGELLFASGNTSGEASGVPPPPPTGATARHFAFSFRLCRRSDAAPCAAQVPPRRSAAFCENRRKTNTR